MVNILDVDSQIRSKFENEKKELPTLIKHRDELVSLNMDDCKVLENIKQLNNKIESIQSSMTYNFYILDTAHIIDEYTRILKTPIKVSFMNPKRTATNTELVKLEKSYFDIVKKYNVHIQTSPSQNIQFETKCDNCNSVNFYNSDNTYFVCNTCYKQIEYTTDMLSYTDYGRINITSKYMYDRRIHFKECINQYQGIENCMIPQKLYTELEREFEKHGLLYGVSTTPKETRFSKITKEHIHIFLKELGYSKYYENITLIHYTLTGKKPDNISHIVDKLFADFDMFIEAYDNVVKDVIDRKSFINIQYVLLQLLHRHHHPCKLEDFNMLKTIERQTFHDQVTSDVFNHLGWTFISIY
jgi:hypothetical protein